MRLPRVLGAHDLPPVELQAARLDGEVYAVDDAFSPLDEFDIPATRAMALALTTNHRLIAERRSAAWIHGALALPPVRHELCVDVGARRRSDDPARRLVREVVLAPDDTVHIGGMRVTTPIRTVVDLAREPVADDRTDRLIAVLARDHRLTLENCRDAMDSRRNLPGKRAALERLTACYAIHVVHGVDPSHGVEHPIEMRGVAHFEHEPAERQALARR